MWYKEVNKKIKSIEKDVSDIKYKLTLVCNHNKVTELNSSFGGYRCDACGKILYKDGLSKGTVICRKVCVSKK